MAPSRKPEAAISFFIRAMAWSHRVNAPDGASSVGLYVLRMIAGALGQGVAPTGLARRALQPSPVGAAETNVPVRLGVPLQERKLDDAVVLKSETLLLGHTSASSSIGRWIIQA